MTSYDTSYKFPLKITMRECIIGEIVENTGACYMCPSGKYSIIKDAELCITCPKVGVENCPGKNIINI
jgi:hypothetical protein